MSTSNRQAKFGPTSRVSELVDFVCQSVSCLLPETAYQRRASHYSCMNICISYTTPNPNTKIIIRNLNESSQLLKLLKTLSLPLLSPFIMSNPRVRVSAHVFGYTLAIIPVVFYGRSVVVCLYCTHGDGD